MMQPVLIQLRHMPYPALCHHQCHHHYLAQTLARDQTNCMLN